MWLLLSFCLCLICLDCASSSNVSDPSTVGRFKVYQIRPSTNEQLKGLEEFEQQGIVDFWHMPFMPNSTADVMVDEARMDVQAFHDFLKNFSIDSKVLVDDLAKFIEQKESKASGTAKLGKRTGKWQRDSPTAGAQRMDSFGLVLGEYNSYDEILSFMARIERQLPADTVQLRSIGRSAEGRDIRGIQFGRPRDFTRQVVWIDAGIHSREWTAIHTAVYFIYHIANEVLSGRETPLLKYLRALDVLILPVLNPDGYEFTRSDPRNPSVRFWRKSRSQERCHTDNQKKVRCCKGVDLNRNFDFRFAEAGTSYFPCSEIFHGAGAFSEPETRAIRDTVLNSDLRGRLPAMITMHAYSQLWIYPYSNKRNSYPADIADLKAVARKAVDAIGEKFGTHYMYGTGPEIIYAYAGGSADWAKETAGIKYTYTLELRPGYWSWNGFILEKAQLIPTARETFDGVLVVLDTVHQSLGRNNGNRSPASPSLSQSPAAPNNLKSGRGRAVMSASTTHLTSNSNEQTKALPSAECKDSVAYCAQWLQRHPQLCKQSVANMQRDCARTCSLCS